MTIWDINPQYTQGNLVDRLSGDRAITESALYNLLNTNPGDYSRIFNADIGSFWRKYLQEPISDVTAAKIQLEILESVTKWLPTITLVRRSSMVVADMRLPGYYVKIVYTSPTSPEEQEVSFSVPL
jgi:phage baseplate assembly protein W